MKTLTLVSVLFLSLNASAGLFDTPVEHTVKSLYKAVKKGDLKKLSEALTGEAKEKVASEEGIKLLLTDVQTGKLHIDESLVSQSKPEGDNWNVKFTRTYRVDVAAEVGGELELVRQM